MRTVDSIASLRPGLKPLSSRTFWFSTNKVGNNPTLLFHIGKNSPIKVRDLDTWMKRKSEKPRLRPTNSDKKLIILKNNHQGNQELNQTHFILENFYSN